MELGLSDTTLPVKQLVDANLAWVRQDVGPEDDDLLKSMKTHGLKLPILLTIDMVVADGARRLVRAQRLGWKTVPVCITNDWNVVRNYYHAVQRLSADGEPNMPMTWEETLRLINGPLSTLYNRRRLERGRATREENARRIAAGEPKVINDKHVFIADTAEILGWKASDLRTVREVVGSIGTIAGQDAATRAELLRREGRKAAAAVPDRAAPLLEEMRRLELDGGGVEGGLYTLLRRVRLMAQGKDASHLKTGRAKRKIGSPTFTERKAATVGNTDAVGRELDAQTMLNMAKVLSTLGVEASSYTHVRPSVVMDDVVESAKKMRLAVAQINALVRVMRAYVQLLEERTQP